MSGLPLAISNRLCMADQQLTLGEQRLLKLACCRLYRLPSARQMATRITAQEFADRYGLSRKRGYNAMLSAVDTLWQRESAFFHPGGALVKVRWLVKCQYRRGTATLWWNPEMLPHLTGLRKQFTEYDLQAASGLASVHSWRLLEALARYRDTGWAEYSLAGMHHLLAATPGQQGHFGRFRAEAIDPSMSEINRKASLCIEMKPLRRKPSKGTSSLLFEFSFPAMPAVKDPQGDLFSP